MLRNKFRGIQENRVNFFMCFEKLFQKKKNSKLNFYFLNFLQFNKCVILVQKKALFILKPQNEFILSVLVIVSLELKYKSIFRIN